MVTSAINVRTVAAYLPSVERMSVKQIASSGLNGGYSESRPCLKYLI